MGKAKGRLVSSRRDFEVFEMFMMEDEGEMTIGLFVGLVIFGERRRDMTHMSEMNIRYILNIPLHIFQYLL